MNNTLGEEHRLVTDASHDISSDEITFSELETGEDPSILKLRKVISNILRQEKENE